MSSFKPTSPFMLKAASGYNPKAPSKIAPEPVTILCDEHQVVYAIIPYQTPAAGTIRAHMHEHCKHDGKKLFIFRNENGWSTIDLASKPNDPKLTAGPQFVLKVAYQAFSSCATVSTVTLKHKGTGAEFNYDDIDSMTFDDLPVVDPPAEEVTVNAEEFAGMLRDLDELKSKMDLFHQEVLVIVKQLLQDKQSAPAVVAPINEQTAPSTPMPNGKGKAKPSDEAHTVAGPSKRSRSAGSGTSAVP